MGIGGRYAYISPTLKRLSIDGASMDVADSQLCYYEWQADLAFSYSIGFLIPYIGFKYSDARSKLETPFIDGIAANDSDVNHFKSKENVGLYLGASITNGTFFLINIEIKGL